MGVNYNSTIVTDGLVLCIDAANPRSYPKSGSLFYDLSSEKKISNIVGSFTYLSSNNGCIQFNATSPEIITPLSGDLTTEIYSVNFFAKSDIQNERRGMFGFSEGNDYAYKTFSIQQWNGGNNTITVFIGNGNSFPSLFLNCPFDMTNWNFYSVVIRPTSFKLKINETLIYDNDFGVGFRNNFDSAILGSRGLGNQVFNGKISNLLIYKKELSDSEIRQNYTALRGRYGL